MATTLISARLPPDIDPTKAQLAYGGRALPKLNEELNDLNLETRQKALMALCDVVHNPEYVVQTIKCSIIESLKKLLKDEDAVVRMKASEVMLIISGHAVGRQSLIDEAVIEPLSTLFDDGCYDVRHNAHKTMEMISSAPPGPVGIVDCNLIPVLIQKLEVEDYKIQLLILDTLHRCVRVNAQQALEHNGMAVFTKLLKHDMNTVRAKAAMDIKELSFPTEGKDAACDEGTIEILAGLLTDGKTDVRAQVCAALMTITITTRGKLMAMKCAIIPNLITLLDDPSVEVRLNALKLVTTLSETPDGRKQLLDSLSLVTDLKADADSAAVRKAAQIAEKSITWKP